MSAAKKLKCAVRFTTLAVFATVSVSAMGQTPADFPRKPVRLVVSTPPSGGTDLLARTLAPKLAERWGHTLVIENRTGASGLVAMENIAAAAPDGYSLGIFNASHLLTAKQSGKLSFEQARDFTPVAVPASTEFVLVVHPGLGAKSFKEFIALAKAKPGVINYVSSGVGGIQHLANELMSTKAGIKMTHVPYQGAGATFTDLLSGRVQVSLASPGPVAQYIKNNQLIALAYSGKERSPSMPNVPTFTESEFSGFDISSWWAIFGPGKLPAAIVAKLNADFNWAVQQPDTIKKLTDAGLQKEGGRNPAQVSAYIATEVIKWQDALAIATRR